MTMVFVKKNFRRGHCYYTIAEGYRDGGKVKHRTLLYLGRLETLDEEKRRRIETIIRGCLRKSCWRLKPVWRSWISL